MAAPLLGEDELGVAGSGSETTRQRIARIVSKAILGLTLITVVALGIKYVNRQNVEFAMAYVKAHRAETLPLYVLIGAAAVVLLCPGAVLQTLAGAVYGIPVGVAVSWAATLVGQCMAFLVGRFLFRESLAGYVARRVPKFPAIEQAVFKEGWRLVMLLKLAPVLPDSLTNYALSLTSVTFQLFLMTSAVALAPYAVVYAYLGHTSSDIWQTLSGDGGSGGSSWTKVLMAIGSLMLFGILIAYMVVVFKRALDKVLSSNEVEDGSMPADQMEGGEAVVEVSQEKEETMSLLPKPKQSLQIK